MQCSSGCPDDSVQAHRTQDGGTIQVIRWKSELAWCDLDRSNKVDVEMLHQYAELVMKIALYLLDAVACTADVCIMWIALSRCTELNVVAES